MLDRIAAWLTDRRRKALYAAGATVAALLVSLGAVSDLEASQYLLLFGLAVQAAIAALQLRNLSPASLGEWFTTRGRASLYAGSVVVGGVAVALGWAEDSSVASLLSLISQSLTVLGAFVAVLQIDSEGDTAPK